MQEVGHIDGFISDTPEIDNDLILSTNPDDQTEQLKNSDELPVQDLTSSNKPIATSLSKDEIQENQIVIENSLNLEKESVTTKDRLDEDDNDFNISEKVDEIDDTLPVKRQRKPTKRYIEIQSLNNKAHSDLTDRKTLYLRERKKTEFLLTSECEMPENISTVVFSPASKIEEMKVTSLQQDSSIPKEFVAKVQCGQNQRSFYLGQKFGYFLSLILLLFCIGFVDCLPPKPIGLKQTQYTTIAYNCHNPISIKYIDKDSHCDPDLKDMEHHEEIPYDILMHPLKQTFDGYFCSIIKSKFMI